jgi:heme-degrading monooxygenase HmoA
MKPRFTDRLRRRAASIATLFLVMGVSSMNAATNNQEQIALEVVIYQALPTISAANYGALRAEAAPGFASLPGFLDLSHYRNEAGDRYADLVWWQNRAAWEAAPEQAMQDPVLAPLFAATDMTNYTVHAYARALPPVERVKPTPGHVLEIAQFRLVAGTTVADYLGHAQTVRSLLAEWDGFQRMDTLHDADSGEWIDLVCWRDRAAADAAMARIQKEPQAAAWMALIDPKSVRMNHLTHHQGPEQWR